MINFPKTIIDWCKIFIWIGIAIILFSPLYINSSFFFPFVVTKTIVFNIAVELIFLAFLFLIWKTDKSAKEKYFIKINIITVLFGLYILFIFVSSIMGDNFYHSFWSNNERSEGIFLLIHLFLFLIVLIGFLKSFKKWLYAFEILFFSTISVSVIALLQYFGVERIFESSGGARLASTIGNAGYLAGFLIFGIFLGIFLLFSRKNIYLKIYYLIFIALEIFIVLQTLTRGGILAFAFTIFLFILYLLFFYYRKKYFKTIGILFIILAILVPILLFSYKDSSIVQNNSILNRISSISLETKTAQTRLMTWQSAYQGFLNRPLFGWGYENFYQVFDKYFNPKIYEDTGSIIWFDRAHNIIFDRLITGGLIGLFLYLSLLLMPIYYLWKYFYKKKGKNKNKFYLSKKTNNHYFIPVVFTLIIIAYFIQNLFIFDAIVIYVPLILVLGFVGKYSPFKINWQLLEKRKIRGILFTFAFLFFLLTLYPLHIKPIQANLNLTIAINDENLTVEQRLNMFEEIFATNTPGVQECRRQLFEYFEKLTESNYQDEQVLNRFMQILDRELSQQIEDNPYKVSYYLVKMRFNNLVFNMSNSLDRLERNFELFEKAQKLSPSRQQVYFEAGYSYLYLGNYLKSEDTTDKAIKYQEKSVELFEYAFKLNDANFESSRQLINSLIFAEKNERIIEVLNLLDKKNIRYDKINFFTQIINSGVKAENYEIIKIIAEKLIEIDPENSQYRIQLALAYAHLGNNQKAIESALELVKIDSSFKEQAEKFIEGVRNGIYRK